MQESVFHLFTSTSPNSQDVLFHVARIFVPSQTVTMLAMQFFLPLCCLAYYATAKETGFHLPIYCRGGRFASHELANVTALSNALNLIERRYARTYSDVDGNKIVRRWHDGPDSVDDYMLDSAGRDGTW